MHLALENAGRHRGANQRCGDVVKEAGDHEDDDEQHERPEPTLGQQFGQHFRDAAVLEMPGQ